MIGGLALYRFFFQIHPRQYQGPQVIEFLRHLQRLVPGNSPSSGTAPLSTAAAWFRTTWPALMDASWWNGCRPMPPNSIPSSTWGNLKTHQIGNLIATGLGPQHAGHRRTATHAPPPLHHRRLLQAIHIMA